MFQFMTSTRIIFGEGALSNSLSSLNQFGYSVLLVTGKDSQRADPVISYLKQQNMRYQQVAVHGEPLIAMIEEMAAMGAKVPSGYGSGDWRRECSRCRQGIGSDDPEPGQRL